MCVPVLQCQTQRCGVRLIFSHQHTHPLCITLTLLQRDGQQIILRLQVLDTADRHRDVRLVKHRIIFIHLERRVTSNLLSRSVSTSNSLILLSDMAEPCEYSVWKISWILEQSWREWARCSATLLDTYRHTKQHNIHHFRTNDLMPPFDNSGMKIILVSGRPSGFYNLNKDNKPIPSNKVILVS